ncbi:MAG: hypothetical protein AB2A00_21160 [Myxococcota bacterium]
MRPPEELLLEEEEDEAEDEEDVDAEEEEEAETLEEDEDELDVVALEEDEEVTAAVEAPALLLDEEDVPPDEVEPALLELADVAEALFVALTLEVSTDDDVVALAVVEAALDTAPDDDEVDDDVPDTLLAWDDALLAAPLEEAPPTVAGPSSHTPLSQCWVCGQSLLLLQVRRQVSSRRIWSAPHSWLHPLPDTAVTTSSAVMEAGSQARVQRSPYGPVCMAGG